jgi:hypothetical protein
MSKQLLIEHSFFKPQTSINEGMRNANGNLIVVGKVSSADKPNANRRVYPYDILMEQTQRYIDGPIKERRAYGELDHPDTSVINLKNVCHNIMELWWEGKDVYGRIEILDTPSGNILKKLFENNLTVGISSRAMGSVTPIGEGLVQVEDDLDLIGWDFVSTPSNFGSFMKPEGKPGLRESYDMTMQYSDKYTKANRLVSDIICTMSGQCCIA